MAATNEIRLAFLFRFDLAIGDTEREKSDSKVSDGSRFCTAKFKPYVSFATYQRQLLLINTFVVIKYVVQNELISLTSPRDVFHVTLSPARVDLEQQKIKSNPNQIQASNFALQNRPNLELRKIVNPNQSNPTSLPLHRSKKVNCHKDQKKRKQEKLTLTHSLTDTPK